jgi:hypothetical protein
MQRITPFLWFNDNADAGQPDSNPLSPGGGRG